MLGFFPRDLLLDVVLYGGEAMGFKKRSGSILTKTLHKDLTIQSLVRGGDNPELEEKVSKLKEQKRLDSLLVHQRAFLEEKTIRHVGLVAGFGAGKSYSLTVKILQLCYDNPGFTGIALEPTYGLLNDILIPQMQDIWDDWGVDYTLHKAAAEVHVRCPDGQTSKVLLRSFENYTKIRGVNAAWACVDEIDTVKPQVATTAFRLLQGRIRTGPRPQIAVCSTPEGFGFLHDFFVENMDNSKQLIRAKTTDNPYLPPEYIQSLRDQYPPALIESYLNGEFVNLAQASIFSEYDRKRCASSELIGPDDHVVVGLDFNVGICHGCAGVIRAEGQQRVLHVVQSFVTTNTYETAQYLQRTYGNQIIRKQLVCYPDAAGAAQSTASTKTDHQILRESGITVQAERKNPQVAESFAHANALLHRGLVRVNDLRAKHTVDSLERWSYDELGRPIKGGANDYSHAGDAFRYLVWGALGGSRRTMSRGIQIYG